MNPAALTKAAECKVWSGFYETNFAAVNKVIQAKDLKAFNTAHTLSRPRNRPLLTHRGHPVDAGRD